MTTPLPDNCASANCALCKSTPVPDYFGSPRKCAFDENGVFTSDNWNCVTANALRDLVSEGNDDFKTAYTFCARPEDQSYAALVVPGNPKDGNKFDRPMWGGGFIAMTWYKRRGRTEVIARIDGNNSIGSRPLTVAEAEATLVNVQLERDLIKQSKSRYT